MKLKSVEFQFENCEYVTINGAYVWDFLVDNIQKSFSRVAMNAIIPMDTCGKFLIGFSDDADKASNLLENGIFDDCDSVFSRITKWNDITSITFVLIDYDGKEQEYSYMPDWEDADHNGVENLYQKSCVSDNGFLYLAIGKDMKIEDYIDYETVNTKDYVDSIKENLNDFRWDNNEGEGEDDDTDD